MKAARPVILILFLGFVLNLQNIRAQDCPCCTPDHRQFDFWLGSWIVYDSLGQEVGRNLITSEQKGCLLREQWTSAGGNTGTSYNYYLRTDSTWNQVWIDDQGGVLELKGKAGEGIMVLQSSLLTGGNGTKFYHRISWEAHGEEVIQTWEILNGSLQVTQLLFKGFYRKSTD